MSNNVNIINKAENELDVVINNIDGSIQIIIDTKKNEIDLLALKAGEMFKVDDVEYIVLEQLDGNQTAIIRKDLLENTMKFDSDDNNWKTSSMREFLNNKYLEEIEKAFGKDRIVEHTIDLLSMDGLDDYGISIDKVSLLTIDQYRKYRKVLGKNINNWWWLITPDSTSSGWSARYVQCVDSGGYVGYGGCDYDEGVRPFFILKS